MGFLLLASQGQRAGWAHLAWPFPGTGGRRRLSRALALQPQRQAGPWEGGSAFSLPGCGAASYKVSADKPAKLSGDVTRARSPSSHAAGRASPVSGLTCPRTGGCLSLTRRTCPALPGTGAGGFRSALGTAQLFRAGVCYSVRSCSRWQGWREGLGTILGLQRGGGCRQLTLSLKTSGEGETLSGQHF